MALTDYAGLLAEIVRLAHTDNIADRVPGYITRLEAELNRTLRVRRMLTRTALSVTGEYVPLPTDYAGVRSISLANGARALDERTADDLEDLYMADAGGGEPRRFAVEGGSFRFHPAPATTYAGRLSYYARIPALTEGDDTNWLLTDHPDVYVYGAMLQYALDVEDDGAAAKWGALLQKAVAEVRRADGRERQAGGLLRTGLPGCGYASLQDFLYGRV